MFPRTYVTWYLLILTLPLVMFPSNCVTQYLCSSVLTFPDNCVPQILCFPVPMFAGTNVPLYLCSQFHGTHVFTEPFFPSTYVLPGLLISHERYLVLLIQMKQVLNYSESFVLGNLSA